VLIKTDFYRTINLNHSHSASFAEDHLFLSVLFSFNPKTTFCIQPTYHYIAHNQSEMHNASKVFKRMVDNFKNFEQICEKVMSNIKEYPILCEALINNAMYIVLMNVGMVFSYSWMGKKIRKNLDNIQIDECKEMLRSIQFFIQNNHLKIKMPSSW
jgi:hypothetical protein